MKRYRATIVGLSVTATILAVITIALVVVRTLGGHKFDDLGMTMGISIVCIILAISNLITAKRLAERDSEGEE